MPRYLLPKAVQIRQKQSEQNLNAKRKEESKTALDGIFLGLVKNELTERLKDARVDKIYQPSRDEIVLGFRTREGARRVLISTNASNARVHETTAQIDNPQTPPMFCMLLRKHLTSGKLVGIRQDGAERILFFDFDSANELGDIVRVTLAAEIMGRRSNLMLIDRNGRILDSIKRVGQDMSSVRTVLPGMTYFMPPRESRLSVFDFSSEELFSRLEREKDRDLAKSLVHIFEGISPVMAGEAAYSASQSDSVRFSELDEGQRTRLAEYFLKAARELKSGGGRLVVLKDRETGAFRDFCFTDISRYGSLCERKYFTSPSELLDYFYTERDRRQRVRQRADDLFKTLISTDERIRRRIANQRQELSACGRQEELRHTGELILANIYMLKKGDGTAELIDYSDESCPRVTVKLDKRLTPQQNAERYFSEYKKCETAKKMLAEQISQGEAELKYIDSVLDSLTRAETEADIESLREELYEQGYLRRKKASGKKAKPQKALPPKKFVTEGGFEVLVGRNNRQNDRLTLKDSKKTDLWFHTKDIAGSHVILKTDGKEPSERDILEAAQLAALNSKAASSSSVPVDYTLVKHVKKPVGAKPGMVIFTNNKTLYVTPKQDTND